MAQKICLECGLEKNLVEFALDKSRSDGRCPYCKACRARQEGERRRKQNEAKAASLTCRCSKCGKDKPKADFTPNRPRHKRSVHCLECRELKAVLDHPRLLELSNRTYHRNKERIRLRCKERRDRIKTELVCFLGGKCLDCGKELSEEWPVACFDFHHRNPEEKSFTIGHEIRHNSDMSRLKAEAQKCDLLCACCHRRRHHKSQQLYLEE